MDNSKEIGKAFKERMQSIKKSPDNQVWEKIVAQMDQKERKKRKFIIPFWYRVSGVAILLALLFMVGKNNFIKNSINEEKSIRPTVTSITTDSIITSKTKTNQPQITINKELKNNFKKDHISANETKKLPQPVNTSETNVLTNNENITIPFNNTTEILVSNNTAVVKNNDSTKIVSPKNAITVTEIENRNLKNNLDLKDTIRHNPKESLVENQLKTEDNSDSKKSTHSKTIEIYIKAAPVSYNSLSEGSSLSSTFYDNSKKSVVTSSYGINLGISISDRFKITSGINQLNLSYITERVYQSEILSSQSITPNQLYLNSGPTSGGITDYTPSDLAQRLTYLEIPMEVQYMISNKKLNIGILSGFSTLILEKNSIDIDQASIGSANNLNKLSLTGNVGLNFKYTFDKTWGLFMEPTLKFQLNPYNDSSTEFKPYIVGINFGIAKKL